MNERPQNKINKYPKKMKKNTALHILSHILVNLNERTQSEFLKKKKRKKKKKKAFYARSMNKTHSVQYPTTRFRIRL